MKRLTIIILVLMLLAIPATSQNTRQQLNDPKCNLVETNSPAIRGIRLGMTLEQLFALFPGSSDRAEVKLALEKAKSPKGYDVAELYFQPSTFANKDQFAGIDWILITSYKNQVRAITVNYIGPSSDGPRWRTVDKWIAKLSEAFGLPEAKHWVVANDINTRKFLTCNEFEIEASIENGTGAITLRNPRFLKEVQDRVKAEEEKKRNQFKP